MTTKRTLNILLGAAVTMIWAHAGALAPAWAQTAEIVSRTALRVCADPSNPPFSTKDGEGFENKIAELFAAELKVPVQYTWYPDTIGFVRNTLRAHRCDLIVGTSAGSELMQNTNPYYRSAYSLVYRKDSNISLTSLDDPALKSLRIGAIAQTPPVTLLARKGLLRQMTPYRIMVDTRFDDPGQELVHDVATGKIDVGVLWGPIAGYYAKKEATPLTVVPLTSEDGVQLDYWITMAVRFNEPDWKHQINQMIREKQPEITQILLDYGVPLLDHKGQPIKP